MFLALKISQTSFFSRFRTLRVWTPKPELFCVVLFLYIHGFPIPLAISPPFFSLSFLVVAQIRGHKAGSSPASPQQFLPCTFIATRLQPFLSSTTRIESRPPTLLGALSGWFRFFFLNKLKSSARVGLELQYQLLEAFEGATSPPGRPTTFFVLFFNHQFHFPA